MIRTPGPVSAWLRLAPLARDAVLAVATSAALVAAALLEGASASTALLALLSAGAAAPLVLVRRFPFPAALASAAVVLCGAGIPEWSGRLVAMAAFCAAAYRVARPLLMLAASIGWLLVLLFVATHPDGVAAFGEAVVTGIAPVAVGTALRVSREHARQSVRLQQVEAAREIAEEHARVAREVHDAVGHHLTAIRMQAGAARHVLRAEDVPPVAGAALATIDGLAASALADVRSLLDELREGRGPTLADRAGVRALVQRLGTGACPVALTDNDTDVPLPAAVGRGGYRVLQEAVTNAVRHAGATEVRVRIGRAPSALAIAVEDDGRSCSPDAAAEGHGIRGMRERAHALGGTLQLTAREPHGWTVEAVLPTGSAVP
ncbi:sensor histidine kinase [Pseudonocardia aurantiaca]|uniref:histidine kinase n=1 Tax=Pseudonocardia aurantiaca TaxID=75290 RepID=A0ABW4FGX8_9PSEU